MGDLLAVFVAQSATFFARGPSGSDMLGFLKTIFAFTQKVRASAYNLLDSPSKLIEFPFIEVVER